MTAASHSHDTPVTEAFLKCNRYSDLTVLFYSHYFFDRLMVEALEDVSFVEFLPFTRSLPLHLDTVVYIRSSEALV